MTLESTERLDAQLEGTPTIWKRSVGCTTEWMRQQNQVEDGTSSLQLIASTAIGNIDSSSIGNGDSDG